MKYTRLTVPACLVLGVAAGLVAAWGGWGPLSPPAGAVSPTAKPLGEIEPRTAVNATNTPGAGTGLFQITAPGSYYLTGNITGVSGKSGIEILVGNVTLDLNGFQMAGVPGSLAGVNCGGSLTGIAVLNGTVRGWGNAGLNCGNVDSGGRIVGVQAVANTGDGIIGGNTMTLRDCSARENGGVGIRAYGGTTIVNCTAQSNTGDGFNISNGTAVIGCAGHSNGGYGLRMAFSNGAASGCLFFGNTLGGVSAGASSSVLDCSCITNSGDGITAVSGCLLRGNLCNNNGSGGVGAGIHTTGGDNRVEENHCNSCARGVQVDGAGSIIVRNTCSGNTINWVIAANNVSGPIVNRTAPGSAAISGDVGASSLVNVEPNANFTY